MVPQMGQAQRTCPAVATEEVLSLMQYRQSTTPMPESQVKFGEKKKKTQPKTLLWFLSALKWVLDKWLSPREHETDPLVGSDSGGRQSHPATLLFRHFLWRYSLGCPPVAPLLLIIPLRPSAFCRWQELVSSTSTRADYLQPHTLQATPVASRH